jgi:hypothetical protein
VERDSRLIEAVPGKTKRFRTRALAVGKRQRLTGKLSRAQIARLYLVDKITLSALAKLDETGVSNIKSVLARFGITRKTCITAALKAIHDFEELYQAPRSKVSKFKLRKLIKLSASPASIYRVRAVLKLGGVCVSCGETDLSVLQINHINGEGKPSCGKMLEHFRDISLGNAKGVEVRCANCNIRHEYERGNLTRWWLDYNWIITATEQELHDRVFC